MINRWQGNSGKVQRYPEQGDLMRKATTSKPGAQPDAPPRRMQPHVSQRKKPAGIFSGLDGLKKLIPGKTEELETEDIILLLILYLMYRESGDSELLMIMGAMFLL